MLLTAKSRGQWTPLIKPDEDEIRNTPSPPLATWLELGWALAPWPRYHCIIPTPLCKLKPFLRSRHQTGHPKYMGNMKLDHSPFLLTGFTSCYFVPNVLIALITFLRKGTYSM